MIRRIKIKNFRSLNVDFKLDPVTVLIGRSGTGKTNFVEALRFLREVVQSGITHDENNIFPLTKNEKDLQIEYEIEFDITPSTDIFCYQLTIKKAQSFADIWSEIISETFSINNEIIINRKNPKYKEEKKTERRLIRPGKTTRSDEQIHAYDGEVDYKAFKDSNDFSKCRFSTLQGNQKVAIARIALTQGLACYDFPGSVCAGVKNNVQKNSGLSDHAENYSEIFTAISKDLSKLQSWNEINKALKNLNSTVGTVEFNPQNEQEIQVSHKFDDHVVSFNIAKESEGFRRFFAHLLAVYQNPPKQTLVFEEPERGIHPGALQSLAEILKTTPEEGRGQVILTTHSPQLLDHFEADSIRAVVMENGETKIGRIEKGQMEAIKEELLLPGELLTVTDAMIAHEESTEESANAS